MAANPFVTFGEDGSFFVGREHFPIPDEDEWPTCSVCGSNLCDDDDVEQEICAACKAVQS